VEFAGQLFVMLCLVYYLLASGDLYKRKLVRIAGPSFAQRKITVQILEDIDRQIERFLLARLFISVIVGVVVWVGFRLLGLREAGIWGVVAAVLFAVPYVGPTMVTLGAAVAGFVQFGSLAMAGAAGGLTLAIAAIEGNVLTPWLMSRAGRMNAVAVFVSLLFWGWIWGVWGLLLAVPIMAAAKAVCERIDDLSSYAELLKE
jgi:predicted PurR-regulated permease PerM